LIWNGSKGFLTTVNVFIGLINGCCCEAWQDLAKELCIPAPLLSMYEKGSRETPLGFLEKFARHFKLQISHIFALLDETPNEQQNEISVLMNDMKTLLISLEKETLKGKKRE
jgi:transcriptional regulator with XRE-family HTH domain